MSCFRHARLKRKKHSLVLSLPLNYIYPRKEDLMGTNAFIGKTTRPTEAEVAATLGPAKAVWDRIITELAEEYGVNIQEWNSYSPKAGWALRLKLKKRNIVYLGPGKGCFNLTMILGDRALEAANNGGLPEDMLKLLKEAKRYPEGNCIRLEVKNSAKIGSIKKLVAAKLKN
jgi:Protein of unknown function (DUF3788)